MHLCSCSLAIYSEGNGSSIRSGNFQQVGVEARLRKLDHSQWRALVTCAGSEREAVVRQLRVTAASDSESPSASTSLSSREVALESLLRDPEVDTSERVCGDGATREEFRTSCSEEAYGQLKERGSASGAELEIAECGLESPVPLNYVSLLPSSTVCLESRGLYPYPFPLRPLGLIGSLLRN
ncbi:hypothetical protein R1flu_015310 [Riccia fluitans]|uniref:Uncharacterized protein n=1 Tax=Riccia fluitans TaxID=41844 RepID=A0ABD1YLS5_9MARC